MHLKSTVIGLALGIVGGAATVLLTTPQSGKDVRLTMKSTKDASQQLNSEFKQRFSSIKDAVSSIKEEAQNTVPSVIEDVKVSIQNWQQETAPIQNRLKGNLDAVNNSTSELEQAADEITSEIEKLNKRLTFKKA